MMARLFALAMLPLLASGCANMTPEQKGAGLGCAAGLGAGAIGDFAIATPMSGLLPLVGCAVGGVAGYFIAKPAGEVEVGKPVPASDKQ
jgi:hypothetical protein